MFQSLCRGHKKHYKSELHKSQIKRATVLDKCQKFRWLLKLHSETNDGLVCENFNAKDGEIAQRWPSPKQKELAKVARVR